MANAKLSAFLEEVSGKLGNSVVFRRFFGKTIMAKVPSLTADPSEAQLQVRERFRQAAAYAKGALQDPDIRARYQAIADAQQLTVMAVAVRDFYRPPEILQLDLSQYNGQSGDVIRIQAADDALIDQAKLSIYLPDGSLAESGNAVQQGADWLYTVSSSQGSISGLRMVAELRDLPGNVSTEEVIIA